MAESDGEAEGEGESELEDESDFEEEKKGEEETKEASGFGLVRAIFDLTGDAWYKEAFGYAHVKALLAGSDLQRQTIIQLVVMARVIRELADANKQYSVKAEILYSTAKYCSAVADSVTPPEYTMAPGEL